MPEELHVQPCIKIAHVIASICVRLRLVTHLVDWIIDLTVSDKYLTNILFYRSRHFAYTSMQVQLYLPLHAKHNSGFWKRHKVIEKILWVGNMEATIQSYTNHSTHTSAVCARCLSCFNLSGGSSLKHWSGWKLCVYYSAVHTLIKNTKCMNKYTLAMPSTTNWKQKLETHFLYKL